MKTNRIIENFNDLHKPFRLKIIDQKVQLVSASNGVETVHMEVWRAEMQVVVRPVYWLSWKYRVELMTEYLRIAGKLLRQIHNNIPKEKN